MKLPQPIHNTLVKAKDWSLDGLGVYLHLMQSNGALSSGVHFLLGIGLTLWLT